jgi:hypothetical protein
MPEGRWSGRLGRTNPPLFNCTPIRQNEPTAIGNQQIWQNEPTELTRVETTSWGVFVAQGLPGLKI